MGVHIPISLKAQAEARTMMISANNCTLPANGEVSICPSQEIVLGCYFLTSENNSLSYILSNIMWFIYKKSYIIKLCLPNYLSHLRYITSEKEVF